MRNTDLVPWRDPGSDVAVRTALTDPVRALQLDVDRAFEQFWRMVPFPFAALDGLDQTDTVRVDVSDNGNEIMVTAELPGMRDADLDVSISNGLLTIRGEKKSERETDRDGVLLRERTYGAVERTVPLPEGVDPDAAKATFKNGVLTIEIPKSADFQDATKRIPVQTD